MNAGIPASPPEDDASPPSTMTLGLGVVTAELDADESAEFLQFLPAADARGPKSASCFASGAKETSEEEFDDRLEHGAKSRLA